MGFTRRTGHKLTVTVNQNASHASFPEAYVKSNFTSRGLNVQAP